MHNWDHSWWEDFWDSPFFAAPGSVRNERGDWQDYSGLNPASQRPPQPPGPIGQDPHKKATQGTHRQVGHTLRRFTWANTWQQLAAVAAEVLGPESFGLGVGYGLARSAGQSVLSLFALQKIFVLADVYDLLHGNKSGALRLSPLAAMPGLGALYGSALFLSRFELFGFGLPELEEAHRQRQALLDELAAIFRDPPAFFARLGTTIKRDAIERWKGYQRLMKEPGLRAQFEAGELLGELLFEIALLLLTVLDGVGVAVKLAKEAPELLRVLRTLSAASREGELAGGAGAGRTAAQLQQEAELAPKAREPKSKAPILSKVGESPTRSASDEPPAGPQPLTVPQGLTEEQFAQVSKQIRAGTTQYGDNVFVQGSRAVGTARDDSDIDFAIRVPEDRFNQIVNERFGAPNPGSAKERTMLRAIETGKIQSGEAGLSSLRKSVEQALGMDVDLSVVKIGGPFDKGPWVPLP